MCAFLSVSKLTKMSANMHSHKVTSFQQLIHKYSRVHKTMSVIYKHKAICSPKSISSTPVRTDQPSEDFHFF